MSFSVSQSNKFVKSGVLNVTSVEVKKDAVLVREEIIKKKVIDPKTGKEVIKRFKRKIYKKVEEKPKQTTDSFGVKSNRTAQADYY